MAHIEFEQDKLIFDKGVTIKPLIAFSYEMDTFNWKNNWVFEIDVSLSNFIAMFYVW